MGTRAPIVQLVLFAALLVGASGCGAAYRVLRQSDGAAGVRGGVVSVVPLRFEVVPPESAEEWTAHVTAWDAAYLEALADGIKKLGVTSVQRLGPGEAAREGVVVVAVVNEIIRGNYMSGDQLVADVQILDAASGQPRLTAQLQVGSRGTGPEGYTFGGRIKFASVNLGEAIAEALEHGAFPH